MEVVAQERLDAFQVRGAQLPGRDRREVGQGSRVKRGWSQAGVRVRGSESGHPLDDNGRQACPLNNSE